MRYLALACDYDGTVALHGTVDEPTKDALRRLRASGRRIILVTGRELDDLSRVCPDLTIFDRIVAENGAVLHDPQTRQTRDLATAPPHEFVAELRSRGVSPLSVGRAIVATWEPNERVVLEAIRDLHLELQVIFNKGAVMVLPSGTNKATGLRAQLDELGLSLHNVVGIGDAENDHTFLCACECAVAVANALPGLKERVDVVTRGDHGQGVIELAERLLATDLAEIDPMLGRHHLLLGHDSDNREVRLPPYGETILIAGSSGAGKSTVTTAIVEGLCDARYQFCIIDPEGDYQELEGAIALRGSDDRALEEEAVQVLSTVDRNVVLNLVDLRLQERPAFFQRVLPVLLEMRARSGRPHWLIIDEAHHLMPADWVPVVQVLPGVLGSVLLITVHPEHLAPAVRDRMRTLVALGDDIDEIVASFAGSREPIARQLPPRPDGERWAGLVTAGSPPAWILPASPRQERKRHRRKYAEGELGADKSFYFRGAARRLNLRTHNLAMFSQIADGIDDETWVYHLRQRDYSRWFRESIKDETLASIAEAVERDERLSPADSRARIRQAIEERYTSPA